MHKREYNTAMKTLSISEAAQDLANWLKQAVAGEEICIRSDNTIVALRPLSANEAMPAQESLSPREALRRLQQEAHLSPTQADSYLREVRAERLAAEKRSA
jgi:antitoxin (DNA-binding transcriptional repressor) of toxin-antitoxin stability system